MAALLFVSFGLLGLIVGGEMLVRGAVSAARALQISPLVIGLVLVGFGTSTPELVTSLQAALSGAPGIAIGNVIGSNIGNILLILGTAAVIAPVVVEPRVFGRDAGMVVLATLALIGFALTGLVARGAGAVLLGMLVAYLAFTLWSERRAGGTAAAAVHADQAEAVPGARISLWSGLGLTVIGLAVTILGARWLISGAVSLAQAAGLSEAVIGLTIVAIGTSMPELVVAVIAMRKGQGDVALGNVLGSNIFNILGILGVTALVQPMAVPAEILRTDIWVLGAATALLVVFARSGWTVSRREGVLCLLAYAGYLTSLMLR